MNRDRMRETALGRLGVQLHHGLGRYTGPSQAPALRPPAVTSVLDGWRLAWSSETTGGRLFSAIRLLDKHGRPRPTDSPFCDGDGHFLWCQPIGDQPQFVPWLGVPGGPCTAEITVYALGRGPARAVGRVEVPLPPARGEPWEPKTWAVPVMTLAVAVVHADGVVRRSERAALSKLAAEIGMKGLDLDVFLNQPTPATLRPACRQALARLSGWGPRTLLEKLVRLTVASGAPGKAERAVLHEIATHLGAPSQTVDRLLEGWSIADDPMVQDLAAARELLGLPATASRPEIKSKWRALVQKSHPDRIQSDDPADRDRATRTTAKLNAAYRTLMEYGCTVEFAPARAQQPPAAPPVTPPPKRRRLSSFQISMGFVAVALIAVALGLALNDHVEVALVAFAGN
ncbi:MAG: DnaJ domain-containing protein [Myxococcota bacterium]